MIVYVSPSGARAASAGVWISQAADLLAMAPETNIGSSTPINGSGANIGSDLRRKVINDAAASLRGLAKSHGRNAAWADKAVRVASNLTAAEALKMNVIDTIAPTLPRAARQGRRHDDGPRAPQAAHDERRDRRDEPGLPHALPHDAPRPEPRSRCSSSPGIAGIGFEIFHPGVVLPGALGAVALLLALFGLAVLPISWTGLGARPARRRAARASTPTSRPTAR